MNAIARGVWSFCLLASLATCLGEVTDGYESSNGVFRIRVERRPEVGVPVAGTYYEFASAQAGSDLWIKIATFRHDDGPEIPRDQIRFLDDQTAFLFMGWMYAVTRDRGQSWSVWSAQDDLKWACCENYRVIRDVTLSNDGTGTMHITIDPYGRELPRLVTNDFGRTWAPSSPVAQTRP